MNGGCCNSSGYWWSELEPKQVRDVFKRWFWNAVQLVTSLDDQLDINEDNCKSFSLRDCGWWLHTLRWGMQKVALDKWCSEGERELKKFQGKEIQRKVILSGKNDNVGQEWVEGKKMEWEQKWRGCSKHSKAIYSSNYYETWRQGHMVIMKFRGQGEGSCRS